MPGPSVPPPLRIKDTTGSPNVIPVFQITISGGTLINNGAGKVTLQMGTGAAGAPGASGSMAIGSSVVLGQSGAVLFVDSSNDLGQNRPNFFWDNTNLRLGIGTSSPATSFHTTGSGQFGSIVVLGGQATATTHAVQAGRLVSTTYPLAGGGDFTADRTHTVDTAFLVTSARQVLTVFPLAGGGNLGIDETISANTQGFLVLSSRNVNTIYPLSGGRNLGADVGLGIDTAFLVTSARQVLTVFPLAGGGNLGVDQTISVNTGGFLVLSSRAINTTAPLVGGGNLGADRTFTLDTAAIVTSGRSISTLYPLSGGGDLSANRTFSADTAFLVTSARLVSAGSGLSGGGNLGADQTLSVNTNVRDKTIGFFFAGALATTSLAINARAYIPFNMQLLQVRLASQTAPTGESIIINPLQYNATLGASTAIFASTNRPMVVGGVNVGSDNATFAFTSLFAGSWLGLNVDAVGMNNAGSNLTVTFVVRSS